jgi:hypothetical protein
MPSVIFGFSLDRYDVHTRCPSVLAAQPRPRLSAEAAALERPAHVDRSIVVAVNDMFTPHQARSADIVIMVFGLNI